MVLDSAIKYYIIFFLFLLQASQHCPSHRVRGFRSYPLVREQLREFTYKWCEFSHNMVSIIVKPESYMKRCCLAVFFKPFFIR